MILQYCLTWSPHPCSICFKSYLERPSKTTQAHIVSQNIITVTHNILSTITSTLFILRVHETVYWTAFTHICLPKCTSLHQPYDVRYW